jgi:carbamoyl-phosphate synthase large subunit
VLCAGCGGESVADFPSHVTHPVQYGPRLKALAVYLKSEHFIPYERSRQLLADWFGATISPGTLQNLVYQAAQRLLPVTARIKAALLTEPVVHYDESGIHSGDSACVLPPFKISSYHLSIIREYTEKLGFALDVRGLMNVQYAVKDDVVYVLEVNPRASRTVPFVSKATGVPLAKIAAKVMAGETLAHLNFTEEPELDGFFVKEAVLPWKKFTGIDALLGPEMRSTGEVMGHAAGFGHAFAKSQLGAGMGLPVEGGVLITVNDFDKGAALKVARDLHRLGFALYATAGTGAFIGGAGIPVTRLEKAQSGPHATADMMSGAQGYTTLDAMQDGKVQLIINTPLGPHSREDGARIRRLATRLEIPLITTLSAAHAAVNGIRALREKELTVRSLQAHYAVWAGEKA